jgi:rRNA-processing protein FCF1
MEVVLDTNFIISCIRKRIDFIGELEGLGFKVVVPRRVLQELKDLRKERGTSHSDRTAIDVANEFFTNSKVKKIRLGGRTVDEGLIAKGLEGVHIATLDRAVKREVPNRVVILNSKNGLGIERD